jgi:hypothetical protein
MESEANFNEKKSIILIREMIDVSSRNIKKDGILLLLWGVIGMLISFMNFFPEIQLISKALMMTFNVLEVLFLATGVLFTVYYIYSNRKRAKTYIAITARYTWFAIVVAYNLIAIIIKYKTGKVDFELFHPMQMTLIGLALFVTGGLYREKLLLVGGVAYWVAAYFCVRYVLHIQFIFECVAVFIGFVIPGACLYYQSQHRVPTT